MQRVLGVRRVPMEIAFAIILLVSFWLPRFYLSHKIPLDASLFAPASLLNLVLFDLVVLGYFMLPWLVLSLAWPSSRKKNYSIFLVYIAFAIFLAFFTSISEFFFIDEFLSRYNFIAIDYLVYTSEVLRNIWESFPIVPIIAVLISLCATLAWSLTRLRERLSNPLKIVLLLLYACLFVFVNEDRQLNAADESQKEFSKNGFHALFAAFRNNQIDFERFSTTLQ